MAVGFIASAFATGSPTTSLVVNKPTGTVLGSVLLVGLRLRSSTAVTVTPPAGWTQIRQDIFANKYTQTVYYKVATGVEPASYTFSLSVSCRGVIGMSSYSGVDTAAPINTHAGQVNAASATVTALGCLWLSSV